ncbi:unnamed protein product [Lathyrus sativus]|nr:unnamed protein product [Lathyrus sativus]
MSQQHTSVFLWSSSIITVMAFKRNFHVSSYRQAVEDDVGIFKAVVIVGFVIMFCRWWKHEVMMVTRRRSGKLESLVV